MTNLDLLNKAVENSRVIVAKKIFVMITGDLKAGAFLTQFFYWSTKMNHEWFYKTVKSWEQEIGMSWEEQKRIRKILLQMRIIEEDLRGSPAKMYYRLNLERICELTDLNIRQFQGNPDTDTEAQNSSVGQEIRQFQGNPDTEAKPINPPVSGFAGNKYQGNPETYIMKQEITTVEKEGVSLSFSCSENNLIPFDEIVGYLNQVAQTTYKPNYPLTQQCIRQRWDEGWTLEDFKAVIDAKAKEWLHETHMAPFMRPQTLFSPNFESYLQGAKVKVKGLFDCLEPEKN